MTTAKLRHLRISPRKVRLVANLVRGLSVVEAEKQLKFLTKRAAKPVLKLLKSAIANAENNANLAKDSLYIAKILVDPGPTLKRWMPRAMGRATPIMKRTSHLTIVLESKEPLPLKKELKEKIKEKPIKEKEKPAVKEKEEPALLEEIRQTAERVKEEKKPVAKPKPVSPPRPYPTTPKAKKRFFSRQTFGNVKKHFRRKSI
jgi:large subunit ribosomal protein L22